ncbi:3-dehydroquinate synthase [Acetobacter sp. AN02]|uniref:3-dehydroquinate synthase n=1 Tax=Acetobacter sp. AN02 TaxID=2894186 RepID=UPI0024345588|nr:3-dehydroquinate synthase [Acetobacter sp. AN02]MDG6094527.1 3-dehydroquinate synthase [Acetobacter sp. AN02]
MSRTTLTSLSENEGNPPDHSLTGEDAAASLLPLNLDCLRSAAARLGADEGRSIVLIGLMGAGKSTVGRMLAARLGLGFVDADIEIERAAGCSIVDVFSRYGEAAFRDGERRVLRRLLATGPQVIATGGGAFMNAETRELIRHRATSVWLRCPVPVLLRRVSGRMHRPLLNSGNPREVLEKLARIRHPVYAEADVIVDCGDDDVDHSVSQVISALAQAQRPRVVHVPLTGRAYDILIGPDLLRRAGALLAPLLPQKKVIIISDTTVAGLYLRPLMESLAETGTESRAVLFPPGEGSKSIAEYERITGAILEHGTERRTAIIALGGGVTGDLAGFVAASVLRGVPFIQIPTTLLSQVDSSVGGKTGINTPQGKNLLGAFHQPLAVLADTSVLNSLPEREIRAGYAEILKAALIGDRPFFEWCEKRAAAILALDTEALAEAVGKACNFKASVVLEDEREEKSSGGRALLNLGHTFGHALEAEMGYDGRLLHGEAVSIGLRLAFKLSVRLGFCPQEDFDRLTHHLNASGMPAGIRDIGREDGRNTGLTFSAETLMAHMGRDKKMRDGKLAFILVRGIGEAFTCSDVPSEAVRELLHEEGCSE